ncbi:hypothetical protein [Streptomyces sp. S-9]|uniref:hypothetical protein n=1 Tax=Streptomyces sp. S-9 TaxID=2806600 RepID=UPI001EF0878C|nr:hypothetical protein [Streptomyces sp. S-9]
MCRFRLARGTFAGGDFTLSASPWYFELVYHLGIAAALAVMLGVGGRPGLALHWALLWSVYQRQPVLLDGGDNLAYVVIPFLLLTHCYDRFALPTGLASRLARHVPGHLRAVSVPFHNLGVLMVAAQICLVYVVSGLYTPSRAARPPWPGVTSTPPAPNSARTGGDGGG